MYKLQCEVLKATLEGEAGVKDEDVVGTGDVVVVDLVGVVGVVAVDLVLLKENGEFEIPNIST